MVAAICPVAVREDFNGTGVGHHLLSSIAGMIHEHTGLPVRLIMQPIAAAWGWWKRQGAKATQEAYDLAFAFEAAAPRLFNSLCRDGDCCIHAMIDFE